jgi:hypothetical protein
MQSALNTNVENYKGPSWPKPYRGYYYIPWEDYDDDVCKIFHEIYYRDDRVKRNLQVKAPSWFENLTPYAYPSQQDFERAVNECGARLWIETEADVEIHDKTTYREMMKK